MTKDTVIHNIDIFIDYSKHLYKNYMPVLGFFDCDHDPLDDILGAYMCALWDMLINYRNIPTFSDIEEGSFRDILWDLILGEENIPIHNAVTNETHYITNGTDIVSEFDGSNPFITEEEWDEINSFNLN